MRKAISTVVIEERETPDRRWHLSWSAASATVETYETAVAALAAVRARDRDLVASGAAIAITSIEWRPCTRVGRAVVAAIAPQKKETRHA